MSTLPLIELKGVTKTYGQGATALQAHLAQVFSHREQGHGLE